MGDLNPAQVATHTFVPSGANLERQQRQPRQRKTRHLFAKHAAFFTKELGCRARTDADCELQRLGVNDADRVMPCFFR